MFRLESSLLYLATVTKTKALKKKSLVCDKQDGHARIRTSLPPLLKMLSLTFVPLLLDLSTLSDAVFLKTDLAVW